MQCEDVYFKNFIKELKAEYEILESDEPKVHLVLLDSYKTRNKILSKKDWDDSIVFVIDTKIQSDLEMFEQMKKVAVLSTCLVAIAMLMIFSINIKQAVNERNHEIAMYYSVGYNLKQILFTIWGEMFLLLLLSLGVGYVVESIAEIFINQFLKNRIEVEYIYDTATPIYSYLILFLVVATISSIELYITKRRLVKINMFNVLK